MILVSGLLAISAVRGAGLESIESPLVSERPNPDEVTEVTLRIFLNDIDEINDIEQRFSIDLFFKLTWNDPRLALEEKDRNGRTRTVPVDKIWSPRAVISNDRGLTLHLPMMADVDDLGNVQFMQRLSGDLAVDLKLAEFPFDTQRLTIDIVSYKYLNNQLRFSRNSAIVGNGSRFTIQGWKMEILEPEFTDFQLPAQNAALSQLTYVISARRDGDYYLLTMFLPMSLIVMMAWSAFWLRPDLVPPRIAISTAAIFSLMAFGFGIRLSLPKVSYLTRADQFTVGSTLLVFLALAVAITSSRWAGNDQIEKASRLNRVARWGYLVLFAIVSTIALEL